MTREENCIIFAKNEVERIVKVKIEFEIKWFSNEIIFLIYFPYSLNMTLRLNTVEVENPSTLTALLLGRIRTKWNNLLENEPTNT